MWSKLLNKFGCIKEKNEGELPLLLETESNVTLLDSLMSDVSSHLIFIPLFNESTWTLIKVVVEI
jgi:hypothetical protein